MIAFDCPSCRGSCGCHEWTHAGGPCAPCSPYLFVVLDEEVRDLVSAAESACHNLAGTGERRRMREAWATYRQTRDKIDARYGKLEVPRA